MSNYSVLKQDINNNIYENQTQQITGTVLNAILNEMTASLGAGYQFAGVATLGMNPGDPDQRVFYLAGEGIYTNFGGLQVPAGKLGVLKWDNRWTLQTIDGLGGGGANLTGYVSVASTDDLPDEGQPTLGYLCGTNLYLYVGEGGDTKEGKYQDCGSFRGPEGAYIQDIEQTETSHENGGRNTIKMTLSDGRSFNAYVHNGTTSSGLFPTLAALQAAYPTPVVGQYAFVGAGFPADIYVCTTAGTWTDSGEDYDGDNVDLTDYATKAEVNQLEAKVDGIDLVFSSYTKTFNIIVTGNTWYARGTHRVIPVTPGEQYRLKPTGADTNYAWLTASYDPSQITGAAPVLSGTTIVSVTNGEEFIVVVPTGAAYLYLMNETSNWTVISWTIRRLGENEILANRLDDVEDATESLSDKPIDFDSLPINTKTISGTNWYSSGTHRVLAVTPGDVLLIKSILHDSDYAWLTSSYDPSATAGSAAPLVPNTERYTAVMGESIKITAPENAAYLYLVNENGGWQTQSWEITKLGEITQIESRLDAIEDTAGNLVTKAVNVSDINASNYVIGTDGNWYSKGQHRVIPVNPGETFSIKTIGRDSNYYFLTDAYTPPATYGGAAPVVAGTQRNDIVADKDYIFKVPNGTAYLYFVKEDGGWNPITIELTKIGEIDAINERVSAIEDNLPSGTLLPYYGEKITLSPVYGLRKVSGVTARLNGTLYPQGLAVYVGYMFRVYDTGQCEVYDITGAVPSLVRTFALGCASDNPHCNAVQFANAVESGDFPYLYVSACKTDARKCYVVSVDLEGNSQLIQTITFAEMDALPSGIAMNTIVGEDGYLWASGYKGATLYFAKFELPATDAGDLTIGASSLVDSWQVADYDYDNNVCQGMHVSVGRLYYAYGGQFNNRGIWVYNTVQKKKVSELKMNGTTSVEFQDIAIYDGKMYLELVADYYFVLTF